MRVWVSNEEHFKESAKRKRNLQYWMGVKTEPEIGERMARSASYSTQLGLYSTRRANHCL